MNANTTMPPRHRSNRKRPLLLLLSTTLAFSTIIHAQAPVGSRRMGFATLNNALFIEGGYDTDSSSQFISLDLSTSWSASVPPWSKLKDGQSTAHLALAPISAASNGGTQGSLLAIGGMGTPAFFSSFDIASGSWTNLTSIKAPYPYLEGQAAVSDPNTGLVYIIGGYGNNTFNALSVYDPKAKGMVSQQSATANTSLTDVGAVWASGRNTIVTFGGSRVAATVNGLGTGDMNEYDTSSKTWKIMSTTGDIPPARLDHCMAASDDGSKIVLFGGTVDGVTYFNTIYILDVSSGKWKQGTSAPVARTRMACAFHSYQFIAWGGSSGGPRNTMLNNLPVIYNLNQDKWTDSYNSNEKQKTINVGAVVGGILVVLLIGAGAAFFVIRKRRRRRQEDMAAYQSDAMAAAAVSGNDDDHNVKVLASSPKYSHAVATDGYGSGYGNEYPMNKMEMNGGDPRYMMTGGGIGAVQGYHDGVSAGTVSADGSEHYYHSNSVSGSGGPGSEKLSSPYASHTSPYASHTSPFASHMPSPVVQYSGSAAGTPRIQSPPTAYMQQPSPNPFISPEDFHPPPGFQNTATSSVNSSPNPFMTATMAVAAKATAYHSPSTKNLTVGSPSHDPFQQPQQLTYHQSPPWPTTTTYVGQQSPTPGARAPQVITDSSPSVSSTANASTNNANTSNPMGYVPPPPM